MCELYNILKQEKTYYDRKNYESLQDYKAAIAVSSTVYVGNLSFYSTQDSIRELFALAGKVVEIIMGIDDEGHPCGFCFVMYKIFYEDTKLMNRLDLQQNICPKVDQMNE